MSDVSLKTHALLSASQKISSPHRLVSGRFCSLQDRRPFRLPSGRMSEFPRSSPISILLGCDTRPDVAAPLTSRVSLLTGRMDCGSQGHEGVWRWSTGSAPMM